MFARTTLSLVALGSCAMLGAQATTTKPVTVKPAIERTKPVEPAATMQQQFDRLKQLAGTWKGTAEMGEDTHDAEVRYEVTAAGSVVMEKLFPGTEHEMVTMYHLDGDNLVLTHYCALQNQPKMRATPSAEPDVLAFEFVSASNLLSPAAPHMHEAKFTFVSDDELRTKWTLYIDGRPDHAAKLALKRVKPAESELGAR